MCQYSRRYLILEKILQGVKIDETTGCWLWQRSTSGNERGGGYPRMSLDGTTVAVHRVSWINQNGAIPPKKQLDHICRNRRCVNPEHLEMVTHKENCRRRDAAKSLLKD